MRSSQRLSDASAGASVTGASVTGARRVAVSLQGQRAAFDQRRQDLAEFGTIPANVIGRAGRWWARTVLRRQIFFVDILRGDDSPSGVVRSPAETKPHAACGAHFDARFLLRNYFPFIRFSFLFGLEVHRVDFQRA